MSGELCQALPQVPGTCGNAAERAPHATPRGTITVNDGKATE